MKEVETEVSALSRRDSWEAMYGAAAEKRFLPSPETRCSAYELDRIFRAHLPTGPGRRLLEMGCGGSKWLPYFAMSYGFDVEGVDYAQEGCESARRNLARHGVRGTITCADFSDLSPRHRKAFDVVTSWGVVEHFEPTSGILSKFAECLRPGGLLVSYVPNFAGVMGTLLKRLHRPLYDTHRIFDLPEFLESHREKGLEPTFSAYIEFADFSVLPIDVLPRALAIPFKNVVEAGNRSRLALYRRTPRRPQSPYWCAAMLVIARRTTVPGDA